MLRRRYWRRWVFAFLSLTIVGPAGPWLFGSLLVRSSPSRVAPAVAPAQDLHLRARDGLAIAATYWPGRSDHAPAILLLHGNGASRAAEAATAAWLSHQGYAALTIDFRGHGESASAQHSFGLFETRDAAAALSGSSNGNMVRRSPYSAFRWAVRRRCSANRGRYRHKPSFSRPSIPISVTPSATDSLRPDACHHSAGSNRCSAIRRGCVSASGLMHWRRSERYAGCGARCW
jgi:hypothetical protein